MGSRRHALVALFSAVASLTAWACGSGGGGGVTGGSSSSSSSTGASGGSGGSPSSSTPASAVASSGLPSPSQIGDACTSDSDCGSGLTCVLPTANDPIFGGGPPGGYCSTSCAVNTDCPADSICLVGGGSVGNCVLRCTIGPKLMAFDDPLSASKCRGRIDVRCTTAGQPDVCLPTCSADAQCPAGRVCDPNHSVCVAPPEAGIDGGTGLAGTGAACDPMAPVSGCAGRCVSFTGTSAALCSQDCVLGGDPAHPASYPSCGGPNQGLCLFRPADNGAGDYGFCSPACSKQDDCQNPDFWCFPVAGLTGTPGVANGFCTLGTPCPNGASDCASLAKTTCTDTMYGPICLTADFPLGGAAPVDGGIDDGGTDAASDAPADDGGMDAATDDGGMDAATDDGGVDAATDDGGVDDGGADAGADGG